MILTSHENDSSVSMVVFGFVGLNKLIR